ncbi:MAG: glycosyltransferase [Bacteroidota bacterium]
MEKGSNPLVSVVLPVLNGEKTIVRAIESIRNQTYTHWELIVINDGSSDHTLSVIRSISEPRIRVHSLKPSGIARALNFGIKMSRGQLIARMDADDECFPNRLAKQVEYILRHSEVGLVTTQVEYMGQPVQEGYRYHVEWTNELLTPRDLYLARFQDAPFAHPTVLFRKSLYFRYGGYHEGEVPEDYELWLRWMQAGIRMKKLPEVLLKWYDRPERLSRNSDYYSSERFDAVKAYYFHKWYSEHTKRPLWIFGAGRTVNKRIKPLLQLELHIERFIDVKPHKDPKFIYYQDLPEPQKDGPLILSYVSDRQGKKGIQEFLDIRGYTEGQDFLMMA